MGFAQVLDSGSVNIQPESHASDSPTGLSADVHVPQIESPTRGVYVGAPYAERARNWPTFERSPSEDRIVRFDDREAAEAELVWVQSRAANARVREVD